MNRHHGNKGINDAGALENHLNRIDGKGYPAYKDIKGIYDFDHFLLIVDHVQGDPYAAPSRLRIQVAAEVASFPMEAFTPKVRQVALRDFLARMFSAQCVALSRKSGSGKSGMLAMDIPGQEILERSSIVVGQDGAVEARFVVGLPAAGRRVLGRAAAQLLCRILPQVVRSSLVFGHLDGDAIASHVRCAEDATILRDSLKARHLVAFVADGAILPRRSGVDNTPLKGPMVVPFTSPPPFRTTFQLPNAGEVSGMGIPEGVTLIVGGGYHGKSTLLAAIEHGVYNHIPGDGRELVVSAPAAVKIRAEDGRSVQGVDIRPFIGYLPGGGNPADFQTQNASGSTSQAANIIEAIETGADLLLLDEDTCATNLMIRDARMQRLVEKTGEPIIPFVDRVSQLFDDLGISSLLVLGGSGDYFEVAHTVIRMDNFIPADVTHKAKEIAQSYPTGRQIEAEKGWPPQPNRRHPAPESLDPSKGKKDVSIRSRALRAVQYGKEEIDLGQVAQLVDEGQLRAVGKAIEYARQNLMHTKHLHMGALVHLMVKRIEQEGLDVLECRKTGDLVLFRPYEMAAAINRLRSLRIVHHPKRVE